MDPIMPGVWASQAAVVGEMWIRWAGGQRDGVWAIWGWMEEFTVMLVEACVTSGYLSK